MKFIHSVSLLIILGLGIKAAANPIHSYTKYQKSIFGEQCQQLDSEFRRLCDKNSSDGLTCDSTGRLATTNVLDLIEKIPKFSQKNQKDYEQLLKKRILTETGFQKVFSFVLADCWQKTRLKLWKIVLFSENLKPAEKNRISLLIHRRWNSGIAARELTVMSDLKILSWALENNFLKVQTGDLKIFKDLVTSAKKRLTRDPKRIKKSSGFLELANTIPLSTKIYDYKQETSRSAFVEFYEYLQWQNNAVVEINQQIKNWFLTSSFS